MGLRPKRNQDAAAASVDMGIIKVEEIATS